MNNIPKITEAELKVMDKIWQNPNISAKEIVSLMDQEEGWNKNTTYTILNRLINKEAIKRKEPNFICIPIVSIDEVRREETKSLLERLYGGSLKMLLTGFLNNERVSVQELDEIKEIINKFDENKE